MLNNYAFREDEDGNKYWCREMFPNSGLMEYHRIDGPAVEYADGSEEWWLNGKFHREDGPAVVLKPGYSEEEEFRKGLKRWFVHGKRIH